MNKFILTFKLRYLAFNEVLSQNSISTGLGFTIWRMFAPGSVGLNGWKLRYGFGIWMSGGMYELGLGKAVVLTPLGGKDISNCFF